MKNLFEVEVICEDCGETNFTDIGDRFAQHDAGIGTIYWHTDNLKLQQVIQEFLENELPNKLRSA